ncbi:hypothetical protein EV646_10179 [Kribbella antiqua]|uniref:WD40 repeat protein n=1 Tax=Kribbella antiqua TaxID=2512217 RepID=A0A4R2J043_9ACTN|nr:hypothetical protein [Kribbella antiqua]TCO51097.1 hypothetical protein EV646_10179 [Kribbella antiqua]
MNDLETRLTDALEAAAGTVPDEAASAFQTPVRRRGLPARAWMVVAAAAVAAAVVVPLLVRQSAIGPTTTTCPAGAIASPPKASPSGGVPAGDPPRVPYLVDPRNGEPKYLQDGDVRVPLRIGQSFVSYGRVACGWVGVLGGGGDQVGHLLPDGTFQSYGESRGDGIALSPEGDRVAFITGSGSDTRMVVVSVADDRQVASVPADAQAALTGWNPDGVWYWDHGVKLWKPGADPITIDTNGGILAVWRTTNRMLFSDLSPRPFPCVSVVTLAAGNKLDEVMQERCGMLLRATLSPDGSILVTSDSRGKQNLLTTYDVQTGKSTTHTVPAGVTTRHKAVWEDAEHILIARTSTNSVETPAMRCNVLTGTCETLDTPDFAIDPGYR